MPTITGVAVNTEILKIKSKRKKMLQNLKREEIIPDKSSQILN